MKILMLKNGLLKKKNSCLSLGTNALTGINSPKSLWVNLLKFATGNTTNLCLKNKNGPKRMRSSSSICGKCKKNLGFRSRMPSKVQFFLIQSTQLKKSERDTKIILKLRSTERGGIYPRTFSCGNWSKNKANLGNKYPCSCLIGADFNLEIGFISFLNPSARKL